MLGTCPQINNGNSGPEYLQILEAPLVSQEHNTLPDNKTTAEEIRICHKGFLAEHICILFVTSLALSWNPQHIPQSYHPWGNRVKRNAAGIQAGCWVRWGKQEL